MKNFNDNEFDGEKYALLLAEHMPGVIKNKEDYLKAETILKSLPLKDRTPEEERLADLLHLLLGDYLEKQLTPEQVISSREVVRRAYKNLTNLGLLKVSQKDQS